jgi:peptidoglycan/LPS O-acetylase OafA/YrhL
MISAPNSTRIPGTVRTAAGLVLLYGVVALLNALTMQSQAGWGEPWALGRAILRFLISALIAWGLFRKARWAWWVGLGWSVFGVALGASTLLVFERGDIHWLAPNRAQLLLGVMLLSLGGVIALLITPSSRAAFRSDAA